MEDSSRCCGFGGTFSVKYAQISAALLEDKLDDIIQTGADTVVGGDIGCLMHIDGMLRRCRLPVNVRHIAQVLASS
jgi:L-lactate dehydrogenase complex protein LldE